MSTLSKIIVLLGTTASGKTKLGVKLAYDFNGEIISADSRQAYRGMDIGTGKDLNEYTIKVKKSEIKNQKFEIKNQKSKIKNIKIPYHLIDIINPNTQFTLARWLKLTHKAINDILKKGKTPIIVGGTALYLNALIKDYQLPPAKLDKQLRTKLNKLTLEQLLTKLKKLDSKTFQTIDKKNRRRVQRAVEIILQTKKPLSKKAIQKPKYEFLIFGITYPRKILNQRIDKRVDDWIKQGLIKEVEQLHKQGTTWKRLDDFGLEYRFVSQYLRGKLDYNAMVEKLKTSTRQFAKRQMTWFSAMDGSASGGKKMENIHWVKNYSTAKKLAKRFLLP